MNSVKSLPVFSLLILPYQGFFQFRSSCFSILNEVLYVQLILMTQISKWVSHCFDINFVRIDIYGLKPDMLILYNCQETLKTDDLC